MKKSTAFGGAKEFVESVGHKEPAYGIDLGTTNSAISVVQAGKTSVTISLNNDKKTMPSCIMWKGKPGEFVVGTEAYQNRAKPNAVYSIKRLMGSGETVELTYGRKSLVMTPAEVSAEILKGLVAEASEQYKGIKSVVITVPAYFDNNQIKDTIEAAKLAGLDLLGVLKEPTSAALNYGVENFDKGSETVLVYDLGGGTFDLSAIRIAKQEEGDSEAFGDLYGDLGADEKAGKMIYTVLSIAGNSRLGGDDMDMELLKRVQAQLEDQGVDTKKMPKIQREKMLLSLERFKKTGAHQYDMKVTYTATDRTKVDTRVRIGPQDFAKAAKVVYAKTKSLTDKVLSEVGAENISRIILVGGSTKSETIKQCLREDFAGIKIDDALNPDEAVARGAAIHAKELRFGGEDVQVFDVLPISVGVKAKGKFSQIIGRGQGVPYKTSKTYTTTTDGQTKIRIAFYQGESPVIAECVGIGELVLDVKPAPAGEKSATVTLQIDSNGELLAEIVTDSGKKKLELINVFGKAEKQELSAEDKLAARWTQFAQGLDEAPQDEVLDAVDKYLKGELTRGQAAKIVAKHSKVELSSKK